MHWANPAAPILATALALSLALPAAAAVPLRMPMTGVMRDNAGTPVVDGTFEVTFTIYGDSEGAEVLWTETVAELGVTAGVFRAELGSVVELLPGVFSGDGDLWIGMAVETDPELPLRPLGTTAFAFHSSSAADLDCTGCVEAEALAPATIDAIRTEALGAVAEAGYALDAEALPYDAATSELTAVSVQGALDELKELVDEAASGGAGSELLNEGAGTVRSVANQWGLPSYGTATEYVHLMNPTPPKVLMHLYGGENTGFASSNNLIVSNTYAPNSYSGGASGVAGDDTLTVLNAGAFNQGDHILIHQSAGNDPGHWELNAVTAINGNSLKLAKPLESNYESATGNTAIRAQVVIAASYNTFEVVNGGVVHPGKDLDTGNANDYSGGIVYIRSRQLTVKAGGSIHANHDGHGGAKGWNGWQTVSQRGFSECLLESTYGNSNSCSGGGGGYPHSSWCDNCNHGAGGGGNATPGEQGKSQGGCGSPGQGGSAKTSTDGSHLHFGGGGGNGYPHNGGDGGGIVVLGAQTIIIESGASVEANGQNGGGGCHAAGGGGAGGTVVLMADTIQLDGTVEVSAGVGGDSSGNADGGAGGEGHFFQLPPVPGIVNQSYATGVQIWVDDVNVTPAVGDPNGKGSPHWNAEDKTWGATGTEAWSSGPLDLTNAASWTLGEHKVEFKETGGAGGDLKGYMYFIQPFTEAQPPVNDTCSSPVALDLSEGALVLSGTTEDTMGKTAATNASTPDGCGGGGPDVVYRIDLEERALINAAVQAPFFARTYIRSETCDGGEVVFCGGNDLQTTPFEPGTYFLFVDSDASVQKGDFTLAVSITPAPRPDNDTCDEATALIIGAQGIATHSGTTLFGLDDTQGWCDITGGGADVFYSFVAGTGESIEISVQTDGFQPILYLYNGECGAAAGPLFCEETTDLFIPSQAGGEYFLAIDGLGVTGWGAYDLTVTLD